MQFLVVTYGTEGDTRPLAALCHALQGAGHGVHLLADAATLGIAESLGVPCTALAGDIRGALAREGGMRDVERALAGIVNAQAGAWLQQAIALGRGCDAVIVSGLTAFVGLSAAEALRVPAIGAMLIPISPTAAFASPFLPFPVPRALNRASHRLFNAMVWQVFRRATNRARVAAGLPPRHGAWQGHPVLYGVSPTLVPRPQDWPGNAHVCGQWIPPAPDWAPPPALLEFLDAGPPPLYVGFGSMAGFDHARVAAAVAGAVGTRRALFNPGWSGLDARALPDHVHVVGDLPHDWLFPRTSLVVHHGGSGTTHSACRAGVPSVVVPFAGDQRFWARRMRDLGIAGSLLSGGSLEARALGEAIAFAERPPARERAARVGERLRAEHGAADTVALVERYAQTAA